jgi:hypothetical protein
MQLLGNMMTGIALATGNILTDMFENAPNTEYVAYTYFSRNILSGD